MKLRAIPLLAALAAGLCVCFGVVLTHGLLLQQEQETARAGAEDRLSLIAATLTQSVSVRLNNTRSLHAFVKASPDFTHDDFNRFASTLKQDLVGLRSLQLAPNGVITYITNVEQNRAALGHDLFADPKRRGFAERAVRERKHVIAGPIDLIQGGQAIIARRAIFLADRPGEDRFWGLATVLIDVDPLLMEAGYFELARTYDLAIRGRDGLGADGEVFHGNAATFDDAIATADILLPVGSWQIAAAPKTGIPGTVSLSDWYLAVGIVAALLVGLLAHVLVERPYRMKEAIGRATAELRIAVAEAEEADRAKTEFLSTMSHELRTPLTSIGGTLKLMQGGVLGEIPRSAHDMLDMATANADRLARLIDDVLDIQKIEAGKMAVEMSPIDAGSLLESAVAANRGYAETFGIEFAVAAAPGNLTIGGDEGRLLQVLANLMSNAAKFSSRGVTVELLAEPRGGKVRFIVRDYGSGIPAAFRSKIFDRFSQADASDSRRTGGTGLGLNIARSIVELHGGEIGFESEEGVGTSFWFEIPRLGAAKTA